MNEEEKDIVIKTKIKLPSNKSFGLTFSIIFFILFLINFFYFYSLQSSILLFLFSLFLLVISLYKPNIFYLLNKLWMNFGFVLFKITNPFILLIVYVVSIIPIGLLMKLFRYNPLKIKSKKRKTFWINRTAKDIDPKSLEQQF